MGFELSLFSGNFNNELIQKQAVSEVLKHNDLTAKYGLELSEKQAILLVKARTIALEKTGRIEFGGGIIDKIIYEFCDSPFITMYNYEDVLYRLIETFYYYKNETLDLLSDDALIKHMKKLFDGICQGSLDLLCGRELDTLARNLRNGCSAENLVNTLDGLKVSAHD